MQETRMLLVFLSTERLLLRNLSETLAVLRRVSSYNKSQRDAIILNFILVKISTCFGQIYCPSSGILILYSQQMVFVILVMLTVCQQTVNITFMTNSSCCEYSIKTPDDGQKSVRNMQSFYQNKVEDQFILLAFITRVYHDARSSECQIRRVSFTKYVIWNRVHLF